MKYYISTYRTSAKNQLQKKVDEFVDTFDKMTTDDPVEFKKVLRSKIIELNNMHLRCKPVVFTHNFVKLVPSEPSIYLTVGEWDSWRINIKFNKILGEAKL